MARHIQEFDVHGYKGINNLQLKSLNSVNIITGDNNSGKTSLLEIISTVDNPHDIGTWTMCLREPNRRYFNGFYNMFPIDNSDKIIEYSYVDVNEKRNNVCLKAKFEETQISDEEMYKINSLKKIGELKRKNEMVNTVCMHLSTFVNDQKVKEYKVYDFQTRASFFKNKNPEFVRAEYVSPNISMQERYFLRDVLLDSESYTELINVLQEFDNSILNISAVESKENSSTVEYMILSKKHKEALPLNSYGDGMKKTVIFMCALIRAKNGILLLDEFETAIHTSAMDVLFPWLIRTAIKLNVQLFMTTHSKEAIQKVLAADEDLKDYINLYTLYDYQGKNYVRMMTCEEAIHAQNNLGVELR